MRESIMLIICDAIASAVKIKTTDVFKNVTPFLKIIISVEIVNHRRRSYNEITHSMILIIDLK